MEGKVVHSNLKNNIILDETLVKNNFDNIEEISSKNLFIKKIYLDILQPKFEYIEKQNLNSDYELGKNVFSYENKEYEYNKISNDNKINFIDKIFIKNNNIKKDVHNRSKIIVFNYLFTNLNTLESIGTLEKLSRERIRQIINQFESKYTLKSEYILKYFKFQYLSYDLLIINYPNYSLNLFKRIKQNEIYRNLPIWKPNKSELLYILLNYSYNNIKNLNFENEIINTFTFKELVEKLDYLIMDSQKHKIVIKKLLLDNKVIKKDDIEWVAKKFNFSFRSLEANLERYSLDKSFNILKSSKSEFIYFEKTIEKERLIKKIIQDFITWEKGIYHADYILNKNKDELFDINITTAKLLDTVIELFNDDSNLNFISNQRAPFIQNKNFGKIESNSNSNDDFFAEIIINNDLKTYNSFIHYIVTNFGWKKETIGGSKLSNTLKEIFKI